MKARKLIQIMQSDVQSKETKEIIPAAGGMQGILVIRLFAYLSGMQ